MSTLQITQANRPLAITTPLGKDVLGLRAIHVREELSGGFTIEAELSSTDPDIDFDQIVGHPVTVQLDLPGDARRFWHAHVARFLMVEDGERFFHYRALLVPWMWAMTRSADCRIFQNLTVPEIVQQVFRDRGSNEFELRLSGAYQPVEYCVQYRETDFAFVSRLLEREGIAYYTKHDDKQGLLVLGDEKPAYDPATVGAELPYRPGGDAANREQAVVSWVIEQAVQATQFQLTDYNPLKPKESLLRLAKVDRSHGMNDRRVFDFPGAYDSTSEAERLTRIRLDELQTGAEVVHARTTCLGLGAGNLFTLKDHPRSEQNREYLVTTLELDFDAGEFASDPKSSPPQPTCSFTAIPSTQTFRPARKTPKPMVHGPQPAVVVGPSGEEIHTDEHGRVKVNFFWDRESKGDEKSSCWVRVAHGWAGKKMGTFFLPRIGHEVLVEFLEGDPDRPIITGSVHNADNKPPYALPAEKTKAALKTLSSKGGGGSNELRFEDKKGSEEIYLNAEKDLQVNVKEKHVEAVGKDRVTTVDGDTLTKLKGEHHLTVEGNESAKFGADRNVAITGNRHDKIDGADHLGVAGDRLVKIDGADNLTVGGDLVIKTTKKATVDAGADIHLKSGGAYAIQSATSVHIKAGTTLVIEAGTQLSLKVGGNLIDIGPAGVNVVGTLVGINSGGAAGSGAGCSPLAPVNPEEPDPPRDPEGPPDLEAAAVTAFQEGAETVTALVSPAAAVLDQAAADGTPFCEECARAEAEAEEGEAEELAVIESISIVEGDGLLASGNQWVNLPKEAKWADTANGVTSQDRLGQKLKFKVAFSQPGSHPFKVRMLPGEANDDVSDAEKGRNAKFKFQDQEKSYTTDADGTKTVADDFFTSCCGLDEFKLVAEDTTNQIEVESGTVTVHRLVYYQPIVMKGSAAPDFAAWRAEYARLGIDLVALTAAEIQALSNIGSDADSNTYQQRVKAAFGKSAGNDKKPHCVAVGITGYLAAKNPNVDLPELEADDSGPDADPVDVPVRATSLVGGGMRQESLWIDLVDGEGWFVSGEFVQDDGNSVPITQAMCRPVATASNAHDFRWVSVDVSELPAGGGTIRLRVNVVDRWRNGLSFGGGNLICIAGKVSWRDRDAAEMNQTLIHEMGHKIGMVCDGQGSAPDAPAERYTERGHVGEHCYHGLGLIEDFRDVDSGAGCVMFGSNVTGRPNEFCENCSPAVRKMDLSAGFPS